MLPEHLHCVWTLPLDDAKFSQRWRYIKATFSHDLHELRQHADPRVDIWQARFWEHAIRSKADYEAHLNYIHYNPVKHAHVARVADWPYSSFHRFVRRGVYPLDWASGGLDDTRGYGERA